MESTLQGQLKAWRQHLHRYPETGFDEVKTSDFVATILTALGLDVHRGIGGTGLVASLTVGNGKRAIGLRAGTFATRTGGIMASEDNFVIRINGRGTHAARPHMGVDPIVVASQVVLALQTIVSRNLDPGRQAVISCTEFVTDGLRNVIPSTVTIKGDTRSYSRDVQALLETRMREICEGICRTHGADCAFEYTHEFAPTVNSPEYVDVAVRAATNVAGAEGVDPNVQPMMISEDFGAVPSCGARQLHLHRQRGRAGQRRRAAAQRALRLQRRDPVDRRAVFRGACAACVAGRVRANRRFRADARIRLPRHAITPARRDTRRTARPAGRHPARSSRDTRASCCGTA